MPPSEKQAANTPTERSSDELTDEQRAFARVLGEELAKHWEDDWRASQAAAPNNALTTNFP